MGTRGRITPSVILAASVLLAGVWGSLRAEEPGTGKPRGKNLLLPERWADKFHTGDWSRDGDVIMCDSKGDPAKRNCYQNYVTLNQETPLPIVVTVWSKAENVARGYSIMLDFVCKGEPNASHGIRAPFPTGTHDWVRRRIIVIAGTPIVQANPHLWFEHQPGGKVWFKDIDVHQVDSRETLADLDGITEESLRNYNRSTTDDVPCVGLVGGEPEIIADVMVKHFKLPREKVLALFKVPPSRNLYYSETDVVVACWAADRGKGDLQDLYDRKRKMPFNAFMKDEMKLDDAGVKAFKETAAPVFEEIGAAKIRTILSIIEKLREKYR